MPWKKLHWGVKGTDYKPAPNGSKMYCIWEKTTVNNNSLVNICEKPNDKNLGHANLFQISSLNDSTAYAVGKEDITGDVSAILYIDAKSYKTMKKRPMTNEQISSFHKAFTKELADFPPELKNQMINDLDRYILSVTRNK